MNNCAQNQENNITLCSEFSSAFMPHLLAITRPWRSPGLSSRAFLNPRLATLIISALVVCYSDRLTQTCCDTTVRSCLLGNASSSGSLWENLFSCFCQKPFIIVDRTAEHSSPPLLLSPPLFTFI